MGGSLIEFNSKFSCKIEKTNSKVLKDSFLVELFKFPINEVDFEYCSNAKQNLIEIPIRLLIEREKTTIRKS